MTVAPSGMEPLGVGISPLKFKNLHLCPDFIKFDMEPHKIYSKVNIVKIENFQKLRGYLGDPSLNFKIFMYAAILIFQINQLIFHRDFPSNQQFYIILKLAFYALQK